MPCDLYYVMTNVSVLRKLNIYHWCFISQLSIIANAVAIYVRMAKSRKIMSHSIYITVANVVTVCRACHHL